MSARVSRTLSVFAVLVAGGMIFGGVAIALGASVAGVLMIVVILAAALAWCVTR